MARKERERRYISEYLLHTYPEGHYQLNVELGPIPHEYVQRYGLARAAALFRPTRPRVDAVHWSSDQYILIEAKVREIKNGIGDLLYYLGQAKLAPDLPNYEDQPIVAVLVVPWMLEWLAPAAEAAGITVVVFRQAWIDDYVKERQHYQTADYRAERDEKKRLRDILGVD